MTLFCFAVEVLRKMDMEDIFQDLLLSVGISVAVCCMIMKLKPYGNEDEAESFKKSYDETEKAVFSEFFELLGADTFDEANVNGHGEIGSEFVEDQGVGLHDLSVLKEVVGGDESECLSHEICNVFDDSHVVSEIVEDVSVFETLKLDEYKGLGGERTEKSNFGEIEEVLYEDDELSQAEIEEITRISGIEDDEQRGHRGEKEEEGLFDDWEGVDRTELEKLFGTAVVFVGSKSNAGLIDRDMKFELYGLHKIALEGPCRGAQPMSLNVSARAKWDSWKRLGNMSRELAMEQYLLILSDRVPGWQRNNLPVK